MPNLKEYIVVGGLTALGYLTGGKLGSMFGAVIGSVVCSMFNETTTTTQVYPPLGYHREIEESPRYSPYRRESNSTRTSTNRKRKIKKPKADKSSEPSKCAICLEIFKPSIVLLPCSHMCFCDECYEKVKKQKIYNCPICRENIEKFMFVYPS